MIKLGKKGKSLNDLAKNAISLKDFQNKSRERFIM